MNLTEALEITMPYIKYLAHDSRLYDSEDIIQEGMIATWHGVRNIDHNASRGEKITYLKRRVEWRVNNFIMSNLVHVKIGRNTLRLMMKEGIDVIAKYRALPCANFNHFKSRELSPFKQACFNEGLRKVKKKEQVRDYI